MATIIRDKIKQPDGKNFKLLDAIDVEHSYSDADGSIQVTSVKEYLDELTEDIKTNAANIASLDDKYYTESEVDAMLEGKSDSEHVHDEYLTSDDIANKVDKSYVDSELVKKSDDGHTHEQYLESSDISHLATTEYVNENFALKSDLENIDLSGYETKDDAKSKLDEAKGYTDTKTTDMATTAVVDDKISTHNTSATAHNDIRELISALSTKVNNFLDVDDTTTDQLSEVLELINNNKGTLDSITSNKVNVSDIVDNLTTANASKVLSANQGVILKGLIDTLQETVDSKAASNHVHEEYLVASDISNKADTSYVDSELAKKVDSAEISHSSDTLGESATIKDGKLSIVVDAYTKAETLNKIQEKITEINGGESAGEVLGALNSYKETNDARVGALDAKIDSSIEEVKLDAANRDTVVLVEAQKSVNAVKEVLDAHVENTSIHITSAEREAWNNKSEFSGDYNDLTNAPNIYEDSSNNLVIADPDGNIIFKSDSIGFETTTLTAQTVIVSGTDVKSALDSIESNVTNITNGDIVVAKATYAESAGTATNANHANSADTANEAAHATSSDTATNATNATNAENANHATNADTAANADHASSADTASDSSKFGGQLPSYYAKADHDHNEYVTEDELNGKGYLTSVPSEYITETELNSKGYLTEGNLSSYAKKTEIPEVVDNLTSTSTTAALSAKQGAVLKAAIDSITGDMEELGGGDMMKAKYDTNNDGIVDNAEKLEGHPAEYFAIADHTHDEYLTTDDISGKADKSYVDEEINAAKLDASNKDTVVLVEAQKCIAAVQNTLNTHVDNDDIHISAEERISWNNKADKTYVDDLIKGLSAEGTADAGVVQAALTAHTNDKNNPHGVTAAQVDAYTKAEIDSILSSKTFVQIITWEDDD